MDIWYDDEDEDIDYDFSKFKKKFSVICEHCEGLIRVQDNKMVCESCHLISTQSVDDYDEHANRMDTIKVLTNDQCRQVTHEYEMMNKDCELSNVRPLPKIIISTAVNIFSDLKKCIDETRNKKRRQYMAACLYISSRVHNLLRSKKEIQLFCGLSDRNITTTISEIYVAVNKGDIAIEGLKDVRVSFTKSICAKINISDKHIDSVCCDVVYITEIISANMLISSNFDGKTLGAVYVALKINGFDIDVKKLCKTSSVNVDTVQNVAKIIFNEMLLFTRFTERCQKIADEIEAKQGSCSPQDVIHHIKNKTM